MPKISVVLPTFNRASYLDAAIESVLAQRGADLELVISDNCSSDATVDVVRKYLEDPRVRYFRNEENIGMVRNWHKAVFDLASADWFMLLSDDDYLVDPDYLAKASDLIDNNDLLTLVYADGYLLDEETGNRTLLDLPFSGVVPGGKIFASRGTVAPQDFTLCNVLFDRNRAAELGAFSNPDNLSCDSELFLKLAAIGYVGIIKGPVSVYRSHPGNLIKTVSKSARFAYGGIDAFVSPYIFSKGRISEESRLDFRRNTKIERLIARLLLVIACHDWALYLKCRGELENTVPELCSPISGSTGYRLILFLCRFGGWFLPLYMEARNWITALYRRWQRVMVKNRGCLPE
ncbi:MAG: glycosyltransferase [Rhodocyclaceae bacterium]|nr:glycosyltransferase [Rhodocyclaceae bacterium]